MAYLQSKLHPTLHWFPIIHNFIFLTYLPPTSQSLVSKRFDFLVRKHFDFLLPINLYPPRIYLWPLRHFPLWPTCWVFADFPFFWPCDIGQFTKTAIHWTVEPRWDHLPASDNAKLIPFTTCPGALTPTAGLPSARHKSPFRWTPDENGKLSGNKAHGL